MAITGIKAISALGLNNIKQTLEKIVEIKFISAKSSKTAHSINVEYTAKNTKNKTATISLSSRKDFNKLTYEPLIGIVKNIKITKEKDNYSFLIPRNPFAPDELNDTNFIASIVCDGVVAETKEFKLKFEDYKELIKDNNNNNKNIIREGWYKDEKDIYNYYNGKTDRNKFEKQIYLGDYLVTVEEKTNIINFKFKKIWEDTINLDSDIGYKFRMVIAESNFKTEIGEAKKDKNGKILKDKNGKEFKESDKIIAASTYELYIISASIDNRKKIGKKYFGNTYKEVVEQSGQYDGTSSSTYKDLIETLSKKWWAGKNWYGEQLVMDYLGRVHQAVVHQPDSERCAVNVLKSNFELKDADYILAYTHNGKYIFTPYSYAIEFDKSKCWIKTVESSTNAFPELKKI